jgi:hypothetical protein
MKMLQLKLEAKNTIMKISTTSTHLLARFYFQLAMFPPDCKIISIHQEITPRIPFITYRMPFARTNLDCNLTSITLNVGSIAEVLPSHIYKDSALGVNNFQSF